MNNTFTHIAVGSDPIFEDQSFAFRVILAVSMAFIMLSSVVGNIFTLIAVYRVRALHTMTSVFVVNLAVADCLAGLLCMPFAAVSAVRDAWVFGDVACMIIGFLNGTFCATSMMTLGVVAVERYFAICRPFDYHSIMTSNLAGVMIAYTWVYSVFVAALPLVGWSHYRYWSMEFLCTVAWNFDKFFTTFCTLTCFSVPLWILMFTYYHIFKIAIKQQRAVAATRSNLKRGDSTAGSGGMPEAKAAFVLFTVIGTFMACWAPHMVGMLCLAFFQSCPFPGWFFSVSTWLGLLNSGCNPIIYGIMNKQFREAYIRIVKCSWGQSWS